MIKFSPANLPTEKIEEKIEMPMKMNSKKEEKPERGISALFGKAAPTMGVLRTSGY